VKRVTTHAKDFGDEYCQNCQREFYFYSNSHIIVDMPHFDSLRHLIRADGLPWWSPSQVMATICCMCSVGSVCMHALLCLIFIIAVHLGNKVIFYQLSLSAMITGHT
jgi:hypothetical protein